MMTMTVVVKLSRAWEEDEQREKDFKQEESLPMHAGDLKHVKGVATVIGECKERSESRRAGFGVQVQG